jgi:hypothetical protein
LTVVLLSLSLALVFLATLAMIDGGIDTITYRYIRSWHVVWIPLQLLAQLVIIFFDLPRDLHVAGSFPFPSGYQLGALLLVNLLAAHFVRFRVNWKRSGILVIHSGLVLLMVGELIAGTFAVEGRMTIQQGSSSDYVEDFHHFELAVVDGSGVKMDDVTVVPGSFLQKGETIRNDALPFDVQPGRYFTNSHLEPVGKVGEGDNPATAGQGLRTIAVEDAEFSGTAQSERINLPSTYLTFKDKQTGQPLGTYLVSAALEPEAVKVGGKVVQVALRFKRTYKPYRIHLNEFRFDRYPGTNEPRNYSSRVRLIDLEEHEDREVVIRMNHPLRHRGEALFQSSFDDKTERTTVLQVVKNPGWLIPYISCALISTGMLIHFGLHLTGFLRKRMGL